MPMSTMLPRGCASTRGANALPRRPNVGGELAQRANRFYMLHVQRGSLNNKKISLEKRLVDISEQLKRIDAEIKTAQAGYNRLSPRKKKMQRNGKMKRKLGRGVDLEY